MNLRTVSFIFIFGRQVAYTQKQFKQIPLMRQFAKRLTNFGFYDIAVAKL